MRQMKKRVIRYLKHLALTLLVLLIAGVITLYALNGNAHYADNPQKKNWHNEGPYVFYENDTTLSVNYISGNKEMGFAVEESQQSIHAKTELSCYFNLDSTSFNFIIEADPKIPESIYEDAHKILAISDIESGYRTFRDFLIHHRVIDEKLDWIFGEGHLVLLGDFVDRGFSTTQVLWFIYMLEQKAERHGGMVHFILGNHEIKNLQGNHTKASLKYFYAAAILGKQQYELYDSTSIIGRWMASKNTVELINGHLFTHGGISPEVIPHNTSIGFINNIVRQNYRQAYYPKKDDDLEQLLISPTKGPSWYRGYFQDDLSQNEVEATLRAFNANAVVVGHTLQRKVKKMYQGKVFAIDVNHPKDYRKSWPHQESEGLLIQDGKYYRLLHDGTEIEL